MMNIIGHNHGVVGYNFREGKEEEGSKETRDVCKVLPNHIPAMMYRTLKRPSYGGQCKRDSRSKQLRRNESSGDVKDLKFRGKKKPLEGGGRWWEFIHSFHRPSARLPMFHNIGNEEKKMNEAPLPNVWVSNLAVRYFPLFRIGRNNIFFQHCYQWTMYENFFKSSLYKWVECCKGKT